MSARTHPNPNPRTSDDFVHFHIVPHLIRCQDDSTSKVARPWGLEAESFVHKLWIEDQTPSAAITRSPSLSDPFPRMTAGVGEVYVIRMQLPKSK